MTFQGSDQYTTNLGAAVSILCFVLLGTIAITRTIKLISGSDPIFAMAVKPQDDEAIDLWALNFMFAIESIDPKYGTLSFFHIQFGTNLEEKIYTPLNMTDCNELYENGRPSESLNNKHFSIEELQKSKPNS